MIHLFGSFDLCNGFEVNQDFERILYFRRLTCQGNQVGQGHQKIIFFFKVREIQWTASKKVFWKIHAEIFLPCKFFRNHFFCYLLFTKRTFSQLGFSSEWAFSYKYRHLVKSAYRSYHPKAKPEVRNPVFYRFQHSLL